MIGAEFLKTAVNLYFKSAVLDRDIAALQDAGYRILAADASAWADVADMHRDLAEVFGFPAHYGQNWDALTTAWVTFVHSIGTYPLARCEWCWYSHGLTSSRPNTPMRPSSCSTSMPSINERL
jgi:Barstar (barnase inhibitor)